jgi:hypothetical protein
MEQGLGSNTWWEEAEYKQLGTANLRALFILDKLIERDLPKLQAAWAVAFPGPLMSEHGLLLARRRRVGLSRGREGTLAQWNGTRPAHRPKGMSRPLMAAPSGSTTLRAPR